MAMERHYNPVLKGTNTKAREELSSTVGCKRKYEEPEASKGNIDKNIQKKNPDKRSLIDCNAWR